jgi:hypothetical protein
MWTFDNPPRKLWKERYNFEPSVVRRNFKPIPRKKQSTLRVDSDVVEWYQQQGPGYQTRINSLLRAYNDRTPAVHLIPSGRIHADIGQLSLSSLEYFA